MELLPWLLLSLASWPLSCNGRRNDRFAKKWGSLHKLKPSRSSIKRHTSLKNSPIHYISLPPNPYSFVPGLGFISPAAKPSFPLPSPSKPLTSLPTHKEQPFSQNSVAAQTPFHRKPPQRLSLPPPSPPTHIFLPSLSPSLSLPPPSPPT